MSLLKLHSFWCCMESQNEDNQLQKKVVLDKNYISWEKNMLKAIWAIFTSYSRIDCSNYELGSIFELNTLKFENYSSELNCCIAAPILNQTSCCSLKYFFFVTIRIIWEIFFLGKKLDLVRKLMMKFKTYLKILAELSTYDRRFNFITLIIFELLVYMTLTMLSSHKYRIKRVYKNREN